jgi:RNAse (barnase) inhibitor barstar
MTLREAIQAVYAQVSAPDWARPNLDGLADVLRDLSWRPEGEVSVQLPDTDGMSDEAAGRLIVVLLRAEAETAERARPVRLVS